MYPELDEFGDISPYNEFVICREMGWTFTELEEQPTERIRQMIRFFKIEKNVRKIREVQGR